MTYLFVDRGLTGAIYCSSAVKKLSLWPADLMARFDSTSLFVMLVDER